MSYFVYNVDMDTVVLKAVARKFDNGYLLVPATLADKRTLDVFCKQSGARSVKMTAQVNRARKSFEQVKAVFALIEIIFQTDHGRKPTEHEKALYYSWLLNEYGEREMVSVSGSEPSHQVVSLSSMSREQASRFISALIAHVCERCDIPEHLAVEVSTLIESFVSFKGMMDVDSTDMDASGEYVSVGRWCELNNYSHASGSTGSLEIAHIVSKGTAPQFRDCVWNFLRLTHDEHMEQHKKGWDYMFNLYPHIKGRVQRAREMAGKLGLSSSPSHEVEIPDDIF